MRSSGISPGAVTELAQAAATTAAAGLYDFRAGMAVAAVTFELLRQAGVL